MGTDQHICQAVKDHSKYSHEADPCHRFCFALPCCHWDRGSVWERLLLLLPVLRRGTEKKPRNRRRFASPAWVTVSHTVLLQIRRRKTESSWLIPHSMVKSTLTKEQWLTTEVTVCGSSIGNRRINHCIPPTCLTMQSEKPLPSTQLYILTSRFKNNKYNYVYEFTVLFVFIFRKNGKSSGRSVLIVYIVYQF